MIFILKNIKLFGLIFLLRIKFIKEIYKNYINIFLKKVFKIVLCNNYIIVYFLDKKIEYM